MLFWLLENVSLGNVARGGWGLGNSDRKCGFGGVSGVVVGFKRPGLKEQATGPEPIVSRCQARSPHIKILKVWVADFRAGTPPRSGCQLKTTKVFQAARPPNPRIKEGLEKESFSNGARWAEKALVVY